jgi:hypothetical protein
VALERDNKVFSENQSIRGLFGFETNSFQNCIWNLLSTSGLSQICTIRHMSGNYQVRSQGYSEVLKVPKTFLKITLKTKETTYILVSENTFLSLFELGHLQCFWKIH